MPRVTLQDLDEGMVTEEAVLDDLGNVVLREGIELTTRLIEALRGRGVTSVSVGGGTEETVESGLTEAERARMRRHIDEKVDCVFAGQENPLMQELAESSKKFLKSKIK